MSLKDVREAVYTNDVIRSQNKRIKKLEADNFHLTEENQQLRFDAGYLDDLARSDYEPFNHSWGAAPQSQRNLLDVRLWLYRHIDLILLILGFALAGMALYLAGQRLGWFR
jgi:hypothetical protein